MTGASDKTNPTNYGLTPREVDLIIKAMTTLVENNVKPDFEKLAKMTQCKDATAAYKTWWATERKLKAVGSNTNTEASKDNNAGGKKKGKREAGDMPQAPPSKRGRKRKTALLTAEEDEAEEQKLILKGEKGEEGEEGEAGEI